MNLDDPRWSELKGGYRVPCDAVSLLRQLEEGKDVWERLWHELHHQGDVDQASYAAVHHLVRLAQSTLIRDWNLYGLVALIEVERYRKGNPPVLPWLQEEYDAAWREIAGLALKDLAVVRDPFTLRTALSVVALARSERRLGALLLNLDSSEIEELTEEKLEWSQLYGR